MNVKKKKERWNSKTIWCCWAECIYCKKLANDDKRNGITHIIRHFKESCTKITRLNTNQSLLTTACAKSNDTSGINKFDKKQYRDALVRMLILHE